LKKSDLYKYKPNEPQKSISRSITGYHSLNKAPQNHQRCHKIIIIIAELSSNTDPTHTGSRSWKTATPIRGR
jgi:hypothetical protein